MGNDQLRNDTGRDSEQDKRDRQTQQDRGEISDLKAWPNLAYDTRRTKNKRADPYRKCHDHTCKPRNAGEFWTMLMAIGTIAMTFATFGLGVMSYAGLMATNRNLKLTYRARLQFGDMPARPIRRGEDLVWHVTFRNLGRGLATSIRYFTLISQGITEPVGMVPRGFAERRAKTEGTPWRPLAPREKHAIDVILPGWEMGIDLDNPDYFTSVQMVLYYRDEFRDAHETGLCVIYKGFTSYYCNNPEANNSD